MGEILKGEYMEKLYRLKDVIELIGVPKSSIYRWVNQGTFPKGIKLGKSIIAWSESELKEWLESRKEAK